MEFEHIIHEDGMLVVPYEKAGIKFQIRLDAEKPVFSVYDSYQEESYNFPAPNIDSAVTSVELLKELMESVFYRGQTHGIGLASEWSESKEESEDEPENPEGWRVV